MLWMEVMDIGGRWLVRVCVWKVEKRKRKCKVKRNKRGSAQSIPQAESSPRISDWKARVLITNKRGSAGAPWSLRKSALPKAA